MKKRTSVFVGFNGKESETAFDLYSCELKNELERMWDELADEIGSDISLIDYRDMIGYIRV